MDLYAHRDLLIGSSFKYLHQHKSTVRLTKWKICSLLQKWYKTKAISPFTCGICRKFCWGPTFWLCEFSLTGQTWPSVEGRLQSPYIFGGLLPLHASSRSPSSITVLTPSPPPNPLKCIPLPCNPARQPVLSFQHKYAMDIFKSKVLEDTYQFKTEGPSDVASQNTKVCEHALATAATPTLFPDFLTTEARGKKKGKFQCNQIPCERTLCVQDGRAARKAPASLHPLSPQLHLTVF